MSALAAGIIAVTGMVVNASADTKTGYLNGAFVSGSSNISSTTGSSSTNIEANTAVSVSGTYTWVNVYNLSTSTSTKNKTYMYTASVSFTAPTNCRSVREVGSHSVSYSGQSWSASTEAIY